MRITLIGMSGSGKSRWSQKLEARGFKRFPCDDLIAEKLFPEAARSIDVIQVLGEWMGFPYETGYAERESKYLNLEIEVLSGIVRDLEKCSANTRERVVVDTTGSVIYSGEKLLSRLKSLTTLVHLSTPPEIQGQMLADYMANPRPVLWRGIFNKKQNESNQQALMRCYSILLTTREKLYEQCADSTIDYYKRTSAGFGVDQFLQEIIPRNFP